VKKIKMELQRRIQRNLKLLRIIASNKSTQKSYTLNELELIAVERSPVLE
jgi:hypothetical protein